MFRKNRWPILCLAALVALPVSLSAQDDPGAGSTVALPAPPPEDAPRSLLAALVDWSGDATALEILVAVDHPELADLYLRDVEADSGPLQAYVERHEPEVLAAFLGSHDTAGDAPSSADLFRFAVTERAAFSRWQASLERGLDLESWARAHHPELLVALDRANESPARRGVPLMAFLVERGWDHLLGPAQSMLDEILVYDQPPGSCVCAVTVDISTGTGEWREVSNWQHYDGAPLPVVDRAYRVDADGPAHDIYFKRRTKAKNLGDERTHSGQAEMALRLSCFQAGQSDGVACLSGGCTADVRTKVMYSARMEHFLDAGAGKATVASGHAVRLLYNPGQPTQQLLLSDAVGTAGEKRTTWDVEGFFKNTFLSIIKDFVPFFITPQQASQLDAIEDDKATSMVDGVMNIHHIVGSDSQQAYDLEGLSVLDGTMVPNVTYRLRLESRSKVEGWGKLHAHTRTDAWVDSSFLMAAAANHFVCDEHVSPPSRGLWWRYAAAPEAPQGRDFLRETIRSMALLELGAALPGGVFDGDSSTAGEGSHHP